MTEINLITNLKSAIKPYWYYVKNNFFFKPTLRDKVYFNAQQRFYSNFISQGDLVFDVGANIGDKTQVFLNLGARVISIEPQEICIKFMKRRFRNDYAKKLVFVNKGISYEKGMLELSICDEANTISTFSDNWKEGRFKGAQWNRTKQVPVTTLDHLIKEYGVPAFCKIDVEGFEFNVLKGLSQPIKYISFEFTKEFLSDAISCVNRLNTLGMVMFNFECGGDFELSECVCAEELIGKLGRFDNEKLHGNIYSFIHTVTFSCAL